MAKFTLSTLALLVASTQAFAPNTHIHSNINRIQSSTSLNEAATAVDTPPLAPLTIWGPKIEDISTVQTQFKTSKSQPDFAPTISAKDLGIAGNIDAQREYIQENAFSIKEQMVENGAVIFRDFDLMKEVNKYRKIGFELWPYSAHNC